MTKKLSIVSLESRRTSKSGRRRSHPVDTWDFCRKQTSKVDIKEGRRSRTSEVDLAIYVEDRYIEHRYWRFQPKTCVEVLCRDSISRSTSEICRGLRRRFLSETDVGGRYQGRTSEWYVGSRYRGSTSEWYIGGRYRGSYVEVYAESGTSEVDIEKIYVGVVYRRSISRSYRGSTSKWYIGGRYRETDVGNHTPMIHGSSCRKQTSKVNIKEERRSKTSQVDFEN
jgi:hypothetical protein